MQKLFALVFIALFTANAAFAQKILLKEDRTKRNYLYPAYGANEGNYFQTRFGINAVFGDAGQDVSIGHGRSLEFNGGFRYKRKLNSIFAIGLEPGYKYTGININQKTANTFFDTTFWDSDEVRSNGINHLREKFGYHSVSLGTFFRINFDPKRGNTIGTFLDFGVEGNLVFAADYVTENNAHNGMRKKSTFTQIDFVAPLNYNYYARFGSGIFAARFAYRPSDLFKASYNGPQMPRYTAGIELALGH